VSNESAVVENASFSFDLYIFRMQLHIEIYTASRGFLAMARLLLFISFSVFLFICLFFVFAKLLMNIRFSFYECIQHI